MSNRGERTERSRVRRVGKKLAFGGCFLFWRYRLWPKGHAKHQGRLKQFLLRSLHFG
jgi:hypothetical protein